MIKKGLGVLFLNILFIILLLTYIIIFPIVFFNLEPAGFYIGVLLVLFLVCLLMFIIKFSSGNKITKFILYYFQYWLLLFLLININNLFIYGGAEHEKYFLSNILIYCFHLLVFLFIGYKLYVKNNKNISEYKYIGIGVIIYFLLPGMQYSTVPEDYFSLINTYENTFLNHNYEGISRNHFIENSEFYKEKINTNNNYLQLLKRDLYEYEFNSTTDYVKSYLSVPFVYNADDILEFSRSEFYYSYKHNQYPTLIFPQVSKYFYSDFIIKNSFDNFTLPVTDNRFKEYIRQLETIK